MPVELLVHRLVDFIKHNIEQAGAHGAVVGVSGGLDSAVVLELCERAAPQNTLGLVLPCYSDAIDCEYASDVIKHAGSRHEHIVLDGVWDKFNETVGHRGSKVALGNVKSRLRTLTLYHFAALHGYLVVGTSNKAELVTGYFTKFSDNAADMLPLANLTKTQVREVARALGVPEHVVSRVPTGGLWPGQTDEAEMGVSYDDIDKYLAGESISAQARQIIEKRRRQNEHKLRMPVTPDF